MANRIDTNKPIKGGYILQPRCLDKSDFMKHPPVDREVWSFLLRNVSHRVKNGLKRGSGFFTLDDVQKGLEWFVGYRRETYSKPQITKSLRRLSERNMVETTKATRGLIVTICNYDYYQNPASYEGNSESNAEEMRNTSRGRTKNKNEKNIKNERIHTHTKKDLRGVQGGNAEAVRFLNWIEDQFPDIAGMVEPLTIEHAEWLVEKYDYDFLKTIIAAMHNSDVSGKMGTRPPEKVKVRAITTMRSYIANAKKSN